MKLFAAVGYCSKPPEVQIEIFIIKGQTQEEAIGLTYNKMKEKHPPADGWLNFHATAGEIPRELMIEVL